MDNQNQNTTNTTTNNDDPVDTSSFMNNTPVLGSIMAAADVFYTKVCQPVVDFVERLEARWTGKWTKSQLQRMDDQEEATRKLLIEAEAYRLEREQAALKDLTRPL